MVRANAIEPGNAFVDYAIQIPCLSRLFCYKIVAQPVEQLTFNQ